MMRPVAPELDFGPVTERVPGVAQALAVGMIEDAPETERRPVLASAWAAKMGNYPEAR